LQRLVVKNGGLETRFVATNDLPGVFAALPVFLSGSLILVDNFLLHVYDFS
jgi:hypothetical protein